MIIKIEFGGAKVSIPALQKTGLKQGFVKLLVKEVKWLKASVQVCFSNQS
jgi:hypothetical protein